MNGSMQITKKSEYSGIIHVREINVTPEQLEKWKKGAKIQDVMSNLSDSEREFIMTGMTQEERDAAFKDTRED